MSTLISALVTGLQLGLIYGLVALGVVVLYKATGIANFAVGALATFCVFVVYQFLLAGAPLAAVLVVAAPVSAGLGVAIYLLLFRPNDSSGSFNLTIRTVALMLLLLASTGYFWGAGEPFAFPSTFPEGSVSLGSTNVTYGAFGRVVTVVCIGALVTWFFLTTKWGLMMRATAADPAAAGVIGINVRFMTAIAWAGATFLAMVAGVLVAPTSLLSVGMMDTVLPFAFTGAVLGGLTSLMGSVIGSVIVGLVSGLSQVYGSPSASIYAVFAVLLLTLLFRPNGLFGSAPIKRF